MIKMAVTAAVLGLSLATCGSTAQPGSSNAEPGGQARTLAVAGFAAAAVALSGVMSTPAQASTPTLPSHSSNWSGYYGVAPTGQHIINVESSFHVPYISCATSKGHKPFDVTFWVGLGGAAGTGLEQVGIVARCDSRSSTAIYLPFWEFVPPDGSGYAKWFDTTGKPPIKQGTVVTMLMERPGASSYPGQWLFGLYTQNPNGGSATYEMTQRLPAADTSSRTAEVITEWPHELTKWGFDVAGLADFSRVKYSGADFNTCRAGVADCYNPHPATQSKIVMVHGGAIAIQTTWLVVRKSACFSLGTVDAGEDLVGVLGSCEGPGVSVPVVGEGADGPDELAD